MNSQATVPMTSNPSRGVVVVGALWLASYFVARYALDTWKPPEGWDIAVASFPVWVFFWFVWVVQRTLRSADELQRRIHLEALALAFLTIQVALMTLGLLDRGVLWLPLRNLWFALPPLYGVCFLVASRHYR
jgi:hypothetical protein